MLNSIGFDQTRSFAPLVTIIVPVYNAERYLQKCLESIFNQTYRNLEIIVINDGSKDGKEKICKQMVLRDNGFEYTYKNNAGVSAARNDGLLMAKGEFVLFVDSDDYIESDMVEELIEVIVREGADILVHGLIFEKANGTFIKQV